MTTKGVGKSHELDMEFIFPKNIYAAVAGAEQKADRWKLEPATVACSESGLPKSKAMAMVDPPTPQPSTPRFNGRPFVEIRVKNGCVNCNYSDSGLYADATCSLRALRKRPNDDDAQENDPSCEPCKGRAKCIGKRPGEHAIRALHRKESALYLTTT